MATGKFGTLYLRQTQGRITELLVFYGGQGSAEASAVVDIIKALKVAVEGIQDTFDKKWVRAGDPNTEKLSIQMDDILRGIMKHLGEPHGR